MPALPDLSSDEPPRISSKDIEDGLVEIPPVPFVDAPRAGDPVSGLKGKIGQEVVLVGKCSPVLPKNAGFQVETDDQGAIVISMNGPWPSSVRDKFESMGGDIELGAEVSGVLLLSKNGKSLFFEKPTVVRFWAVDPRAH